MEYNSVQMIKVKNKTLGTIYWSVFALAVIYIVYSLISTRAYQLMDPMVSNTFIKMKGSGSTADGRVLDQYDMVVPPILPDTVFVGTNFILTPGQTQGTCDGVDDKLEICNCSAGNLSLCCPAGKHTENGMFTGSCGTDQIHCSMRGWCPFETKPQDKDENILLGVDEWTLFARVNGQFPHWDTSVANTQSNPNMDAPNNLTLWNMRGLAELSGEKWEDLTHKGAILLVTFNYNCNLDSTFWHSYNDDCEPTIGYERLDDPTDPVSSGFNFRYIQSSRDLTNQTVSRDLWKLYGVYIVFQTFGVGGRFDFITTLTYLGAMSAYLGMATLVCDYVLQYFLPNRHKILDQKFREVHVQGIDGNDDHQSVLSETLL